MIAAAAASAEAAYVAPSTTCSTPGPTRCGSRAWVGTNGEGCHLMANRAEGAKPFKYELERARDLRDAVGVIVSPSGTHRAVIRASLIGDRRALAFENQDRWGESWAVFERFSFYVDDVQALRQAIEAAIDVWGPS